MNVTCFLNSNQLNPQEHSSFLSTAASVLLHKQFRLAHATAEGWAVTAVAQNMDQLDLGIKVPLEALASQIACDTRYNSQVIRDPILGDLRLMVMAPTHIPNACLGQISRFLDQFNFRIQSIQRSLAAEEDPNDGIHALAIICDGQISNPVETKTLLQQIAREHGIDLVLQDHATLHQDYQLVCFDMDSTLIKVEVIDELAKVHGVGDQVAQITARAMRGELEFSGSFTERVALLKGLDANVMQGIAEALPLMDGATRLCYRLGERGIKMAILSGGFTFFGQHLQQLLGLNFVIANQLEIINGSCTGKHLGEIIDASAKARNLLRICQELEINPAEAIAIGDGANDLEMIGTAGLGFAFHAKPLVQEKAPHTVSHVGLDALLHLI